MLVLCTWWLDLPTHEPRPYEVLEFFSGVGRVAALAKYCGFEATGIDMDYGADYAKKRRKRSPMDLNSSSGLMLLFCTNIVLCLLTVFFNLHVPNRKTISNLQSFTGDSHMVHLC